MNAWNGQPTGEESRPRVWWSASEQRLLGEHSIFLPEDAVELVPAASPGLDGALDSAVPVEGGNEREQECDDKLQTSETCGLVSRWCNRPLGHRGWHGDGSGTEWRGDAITKDPAPASPEPTPADMCECGHGRSMHEATVWRVWCNHDNCPCAGFRAPVAADQAETPAGGEKWRHGTKLLRTLYRQTGPEPSEDDVLLGMMESPGLAALVIEAVNTMLARPVSGGDDDTPLHIALGARIGQMEAERDQARAEAARLREALAGLESALDRWDGHPHRYPVVVAPALQTARAALAQDGGEPG